MIGGDHQQVRHDGSDRSLTAILAASPGLALVARVTPGQAVAMTGLRYVRRRRIHGGVDDRSA